jgi:hypothetical protein
MKLDLSKFEVIKTPSHVRTKIDIITLTKVIINKKSFWFASLNVEATGADAYYLVEYADDDRAFYVISDGNKCYGTCFDSSIDCGIFIDGEHIIPSTEILQKIQPITDMDGNEYAIWLYQDEIPDDHVELIMQKIREYGTLR